MSNGSPKTLSVSQKQALGLDESMLSPWQQGDRAFQVHREMRSALVNLRQAAAEAGFDLQLVSAYRSFARQQLIWDRKAMGERVLLDDSGNALDYKTLGSEQVMFAILRWSALPGLSRHHWGCDVDVFDANSMALADVELVPAEVEGDGPCAAMHDWLSERIATNNSFGFFRPYAHDTGGVAPERWHLSYLPVAAEYVRQLSASVMLDVWRDHQLCLLDDVERHMDDIWQKYVCVSQDKQPEWVRSALEI